MPAAVLSTAVLLTVVLPWVVITPEFVTFTFDADPRDPVPA